MSPNFKVMGFLHASLVPLFFFMSFIPKIRHFRIYPHAQKFFAINFFHIVPDSHHSNFILSLVLGASSSKSRPPKMHTTFKVLFSFVGFVSFTNNLFRPLIYFTEAHFYFDTLDNYFPFFFSASRCPQM